MSIKVLTGERYNILATGESVACSPAESSLFPLANIKDGRPDSAFRFSAVSTDATVTVDGNIVSNGSLDAWSGSIPDGWATEGTVSESTNARSGSAAQISGLDAKLYKDFEVRSGKRVVVSAFVAETTEATAPIIALQNLETGSYYAFSSSAWSTTPTTMLVTAGTSYTQVGPTPVVVESYEDIGKDTCQLRYTFMSAAGTSTSVFVDDAFVWQSVDHCSLHGHNIRRDVDVRLESSPDNFATSSSGSTILQATMTKAEPSFYTALSSAIDDRYWRLRFKFEPGSTTYLTTPTESVWIGEAVIGQATELTRPQDLGQEIRLVTDNIRVSTQFGASWSHRVGQKVRRVLGMGFSYFTSSEYQEARQEVFERSFGSANPIVIVPDTDHADVIHGRISDEFSVRNTLQGQYDDGDLIVVEDSFPVWTE